MLRKYFLPLIALSLVAVVSYQYFSAPVYWKRLIATLSSSGQGAYSAVFDVTEMIETTAEAGEIPVAQINERTISDAALQDVMDYAAYYDSFALIVIHKGVIQAEWYKEGYDASSLTQSQSMHKTIQALLVGIAIDDGLIDSVHDPIEKYLPQLKGQPKGKITIEQLLRMSSGMQNLSDGFNLFGDAFRWLYSEDSPTATLSFPQITAAGEEFEYNDLNAQIIGLVLTEVTGERYADYLSRKLWKPLANSEAKVWLDHEKGEAIHVCCLLTPARNWARIGLMLENNGLYSGQQVVPVQWIADVTSASDVTPHYGFFTWLSNNLNPNPRGTSYKRTEAWLAEDVYFLAGYGAQRVYVSQEKELVIVRLGPAAGYFPKIIKEWDNSYLFNRVVKGIK